MLNPYGDNIIDKFVATKIFLGAQAISDKGLLQTDPLLVHYEQGLIDRASEIIVLADSSKFQSKGSLIVCDLDTIDHIITDDAIESITVKILEAQNIKVTIVPSN